MRKQQKGAATLAAQVTAAATAAAATTTAAATPRYYGAACLAAALPGKWAAMANHTISVTNSMALARAIARYNALGNTQGAALYTALAAAHGYTVQAWANAAQTAGAWGAVGQLTAKGGQHPCQFLQAAMRNAWVALRG